jgi:hypothetical protein
MKVLSHSSTNDGLNYYAKYNFKGTKECQEVWRRIEAQKKNKTLPLMTDKEWKDFCKTR